MTVTAFRATRRRYIRSLTGSLILAVVLLLLIVYAGFWPWLSIVAFGLPVGGVLLARDRAARLGHGITDKYLVVRSATFRGRRDIVEREGIIGWNLSQSFFQRRAGLMNLTATTAAGQQGYTAYDIPEAMGISLANAAVPGLLTEFQGVRQVSFLKTGIGACFSNTDIGAQGSAGTQAEALSFSIADTIARTPFSVLAIIGVGLSILSFISERI